MSKQFDSLKHSRIHSSSKNTCINRKNLGVAIGFGSSSSINGLDEMLGCKWLRFSRVRLIKDGVLRFCHVAREETMSQDLAR